MSSVKESDCYYHHGNENDCNNLGICTYDNSNDLCLKDCNKKNGEIEIEITNDNYNLIQNNIDSVSSIMTNISDNIDGVSFKPLLDKIVTDGKDIIDNVSSITTDITNGIDGVELNRLFQQIAQDGPDIVENISKYSNCIKNPNFLKLIRESALSKTDTDSAPVGVSISKDNINYSLNNLYMPEVDFTIVGHGVKVGEILDLRTGNPHHNFIKQDIDFTYDSKTPNEIYEECMADDSLSSNGCCDLLNPNPGNDDGGGGGSDGDNDGSEGYANSDTKEGMISFKLNHSNASFDEDDVFLKIDENNMNEVTSCYIDNITEVQKYKYFGSLEDNKGWIIAAAVILGLIILGNIGFLFSYFITRKKTSNTSPMA